MTQDKRMLLWLDDLRDPTTLEWLKNYAEEFVTQKQNVIWLKTYDEFTEYITKNGLPYMIAFDHDLGDVCEKTGYDATKWLVDYCIDNKSPLPKYVVQSANTVGSENIRKLLNNFIKHQNK